MLREILASSAAEAVKTLWSAELLPSEVQIQITRREFEGEYTIVAFPISSRVGVPPAQTAEALGNYLKQNFGFISGFNVVKGFLNLKISDNYWCEFINTQWDNVSYGRKPEEGGKPVVVEFSSPNTNKPLHLGHIRNILLGWSLSKVLQANGEKVLKVNLVNDRGIHICKSMIAWQIWGNGETPQSTGKKGDHLVGDYYVKFDQEYKAEVKSLVDNGSIEEEALNRAPLMLKARTMLQRWEAMDEDVLSLWHMMNNWVYEGFGQTYGRLGVSFDKTYHESDTYVLGKDIVFRGLDAGILQCRDDGSVWIDLSDEGLDEKLLLRADGTSVYITQDLGTASQRIDEFNPKSLVYVVGNEQEYHFSVLRKTLHKLGYDWADVIHHLSYGMVELPHGKMKSREGTVVDADDLMDEMELTAARMTSELGKAGGLDAAEAVELHRRIGLGALKFFILKVDPKKKMLFNPEESVDFNGHTGPFIQYTYARIRSMLNKASGMSVDYQNEGSGDRDIPLHDRERWLALKIYEYPESVRSAAEALSPALIANYVYELAQEYNGFYQEINVLKEEDLQLKAFRLRLSAMTSLVIRSAMDLLGIEVPERM